MTSSRRNAGVVRATPPQQGAAKAGDSKGVIGRRDGVLLGLVSSAIVARPARAGLFGGISEDVYVADTGVVLGALKSTLELTAESQNREDTVASVRDEANKWVAKYRRQSKFSGRPSYGNTYSAINAVLGHYNNFGASTLFPKRRLERVVKEVDDAGRALTRGR
jgi:photosystem II Psb27 protein